MPKVSIIIPCYKVEKYLKRCLDSVLAQTFCQWEAICVDDGSPDECGAILDQYAKCDYRIKVIHQENQGLAGARNTGILNSSGEWLLHIDSDDWIGPCLLSTIYSTIELSNIGPDIVFWGFSAVNGNNLQSFRLKDASILND